MKIAFEALIKKTEIKSLVSGDKEAWITLRLQDKAVSDEVLNEINKLQQPKKNVMVVIMELEKDSIDEEIGNLS